MSCIIWRQHANNVWWRTMSHNLRPSCDILLAVMLLAVMLHPGVLCHRMTPCHAHSLFCLAYIDECGINLSGSTMTSPSNTPITSRRWQIRWSRDDVTGSRHMIRWWRGQKFKNELLRDIHGRVGFEQVENVCRRCTIWYRRTKCGVSAPKMQHMRWCWWCLVWGAPHVGKHFRSDCGQNKKSIDQSSDGIQMKS